MGVKNRLLKVIVFILVLLFAYSYNHHVPFFHVEGTYALINYEGSSVWPLGPDTLQLYNGKYESSQMGKGTYSHGRTLLGYEFVFQTPEGFSTKIKRYWFGSAMIIVFDDLKQGYIKID